MKKVKKKLIPCVILARKGSKGLKNKNIYPLNKKPLIEYTLDYVKKSKFVSHVIVSTDDYRVKKICEKYNCITIYPRPKKLSNDFARSEPAILHALKHFEKNYGKFEIYSYLQITEPLRPKNILDKCIKKLLSKPSIDSCFAGYTYHKNFWIQKGGKLIKLNKSNLDFLPRQIRKEIIREDSGVALASKYKLIKKGVRIGEKSDAISYNSFHGIIDIHNIKDLQLAEILLKKNYKFNKF